MDSKADEAGRCAYQFQILADTAAELSRARHPQRILEMFLLSAQGGLGARGGFAAVLDRNGFVFSAISGQIDPLFLDAGLHGRLRSAASESDRSFFLPPDQDDSGLELIMVCPLDADRSGVIGLLSGLSGRAYDESDHQLLSGLGALFQTSLDFSLFAARVELLNAELIKQNDLLDRQVFHLHALRDLSRELIKVDLAEVMESCLLTVLGHFGCTQGTLVLHDRTTGRIFQQSKGADGPELSGNDVDRLMFLCLAGARQKHLEPLQVEPVASLMPLEELPLGFTPAYGFLFILRENLYGALVLGPRFAAAPDEEDQVMHAFVSQAVMYLKNADSFATISGLNQDLERQNEALRQTIAELTRARDRISVLEAAGRRVAAVIHRKTESLTRLRLVDFILILALTLVMAVIFNQQNPRGIAWVEPQRAADVPRISVEALPAFLEENEALIIDARPREFFDRGHIPGAVNIPAQLFELVYMMQLSQEDPERAVVVYGRSISRHYDRIVAEKLVRRDHEEVFILENADRLIHAGSEK